MGRPKGAPKAPVTFQGKMQKDMPAFTDSCNGLTVQQLDQKIVTLQKELQDSEEHKGKNEDLAKAKAHAKELGATYSEVRRDVKLKTRYLVELIREKGGA